MHQASWPLIVSILCLVLAHDLEPSLQSHRDRLAHPASQKPVPSAENSDFRSGPDVHPKRAVQRSTLDSRETISSLSSAHQAHLKETLVRESSHESLHGSKKSPHGVTRTAVAEKALKSRPSAMTHGMTVDHRGTPASSPAHETHPTNMLMRESHHESQHRNKKTAAERMAEKSWERRVTRDLAASGTGACKKVLAYSQGRLAKDKCVVKTGGAKMCMGSCDLTTGNGFHVVTFSFSEGMTVPRTKQVFDTTQEAKQTEMAAVLNAMEANDFCMIACSESCAPVGKELTSALLLALSGVGATQAGTIADGDSYLLMTTKGAAAPAHEIIGNALCPEEEVTLPCPTTTTTTVTVTSYTKGAARVSAFILSGLLASLL